MSITPSPDLPSDKEIFFQAIEKSSTEERNAFIRTACGVDQNRLARIQELVQWHLTEDEFMSLSAPASLNVRPEMMAAGEGVGDMIGRYKLLEKIAEGGFGTVYVAEQREPVKRLVALKVIKLGMDTRQVIARFEAERQALALMDHPHIAKVLDGGATSTGRPYFVMELVRGVRITEYCDSNSLSTEERLKIFVQVCHAVEHAHQKGIIHRDIKPSNVLVTSHDGVPVPKVIDFGIAKATSCELTDKTLYTEFAQFVGTPAYISPEQSEYSALGVDTRTDIYALGVLLYELLVGKTPFDAIELAKGRLDEMRRIIREKEPLRPSTRFTSLTGKELTIAEQRRQCDKRKLVQQLKGDLDWIALKCLEKDRTRRYQTATGLAHDIERYLRNEPVTARPPTFRYKIYKAWARNRVGISLAGITIVSLAGGLVISLWQGKAARDAKVDAELSRNAERNARLRSDAERLRAERIAYGANMQLIDAAYKEKDTDRLRQLLEDSRNYPEPGFEWFYWQRQLHHADKRLEGHEVVPALAFSPDGRRLATGGGTPGRIRIWEVATGRELAIFAGQSNIQCAGWSPDGFTVASGSLDGDIRIWDINERVQKFSIRPGFSSIHNVVFSPDGRHLAITAVNGVVAIWDLPARGLSRSFDVPRSSMLSLALARDGARMAVGDGTGNVHIYEFPSGKLVRTCKVSEGPIMAVAFSPDGTKILAGGEPGEFKLIDLTSGESLLSAGPFLHVTSLAYSPDGIHLLMGSRDYTARLFRAVDGHEIKKFFLDGPVLRVAFADQNTIAASGHTPAAKIWNINPRPLPRLRLEHELSIRYVRWTKSGNRLLTLSGDRTARLWDSASGKELRTFRGHSRAIVSGEISPDERFLLTGSDDQTSILWDMLSGTALFHMTSHTESVRSVAFSPDGLEFVTGSDDNSIRFWDVATGRELRKIAGFQAGIYSLAYSPDGKRLYTGSGSHEVRVFDPRDGRELAGLRGHKHRIWCVRISSDGKLIATASGDRTARVWDAKTGRELQVFVGHSQPVWNVAFSPDVRGLLTGAGDHTARLWDINTGRQLLQFDGGTSHTPSVAFAPDGLEIALANGAEVSVWTGREQPDASPELLPKEPAGELF